MFGAADVGIQSNKMLYFCLFILKNCWVIFVRLRDNLENFSVVEKGHVPTYLSNKLTPIYMVSFG
jgi:hypothetical protein